MNILLIGEYYSDNLGDGVICETVMRAFRQNLGEKSNVYIVDLSGRVGWEDKVTSDGGARVFISKLRRRISGEGSTNNAVRRFIDEAIRARNVLRNVKRFRELDIDIAVFAGGQLFMDYFVIPMYALARLFSKKNIPVSFNCCGMGKLDGKIRRILLKRIVNMRNVKYITLRDNLDVFINEYMERDNKMRVKQVYDPALLLNEYFDVKKLDRRVIGLGVMNPQSCRNNGLDITNEECEDLWRRIIQALENNSDVPWEFFTNGSQADYDYAMYLCDKFSVDTVRKLSPRPLRPGDLINLIASFQSIISFRLHSHIIAYSLGKQSIGFIWDNKVSEFSKTVGREDNFFYIDDSSVIEKIIHLTTADTPGIDRRYEIINQTKKEVLSALYPVFE